MTSQSQWHTQTKVCHCDRNAFCSQFRDAIVARQLLDAGMTLHPHAALLCTFALSTSIFSGRAAACSPALPPAISVSPSSIAGYPANVPAVGIRTANTWATSATLQASFGVDPPQLQLLSDAPSGFLFRLPLNLATGDYILTAQGIDSRGNAASPQTTIRILAPILLPSGIVTLSITGEAALEFHTGSNNSCDSSTPSYNASRRISLPDTLRAWEPFLIATYDTPQPDLNAAYFYTGGGSVQASVYGQCPSSARRVTNNAHLEIFGGPRVADLSADLQLPGCTESGPDSGVTETGCSASNASHSLAGLAASLCAVLALLAWRRSAPRHPSARTSCLIELRRE